jgi:predicted site-specific integrase-resolvase
VEGVTVCYARVSTSEQRSDLERQQARLSAYAEQQGWRNIESIADVGSGLNCRKKGLL